MPMWKMNLKNRRSSCYAGQPASGAQARGIADLFVRLAKEMESPQPLLTACEIHLLLGDYERAAEPVVTTEKDCLPKGLFPGYGSLQKKLMEI